MRRVTSSFRHRPPSSGAVTWKPREHVGQSNETHSTPNPWIPLICEYDVCAMSLRKPPAQIQLVPRPLSRVLAYPQCPPSMSYSRMPLPIGSRRAAANPRRRGISRSGKGKGASCFLCPKRVGCLPLSSPPHNSMFLRRGYAKKALVRSAVEPS